MGRRAQEFRPNVVLADAMYSGLSALVRLASKRKNDQTSRFYEQIASNWERVRRKRKSDRENGSYEFFSVQNVEPILRNLYLKMLWRSTRRYGNKESKRVYSWREGTVGPLNILLNYAGSALRDILVPRYPFPDPEVYEIREYPDGRKRVVPKSVADNVPLSKGAKTQLRAGYRGNSKNPQVLLTHPTLPALDFGDMIRAHLVELCRQCFIYSVPRIESQRYIRLFIHTLLPFLDWVYTQGKVGRKDFYPEADRELRKIVLEIRTHFGHHSGSKERISKQVEAMSTNLGVDFLIRKIESVLESSKEDDVIERCKTILKHIEDGIVTEIEISKFIEDVTKKSLREGNDWHRVLLSGFSHPRSLREVVFAGDTLLQTSSGVQFLAEVPVTGEAGAGRIDLTLFVRLKRGAGRYIWAPVMILEIKSKAGFKFNLYGKRPRTKKRDVFVPVLNARKEPLTKDEWNASLGGVPSPRHLAQLDAYGEALLSEYNALVGDVIELKELWKGVVTLDISQDYEFTKMVFDALIEQLIEDLLKGKFHGHWKTLTFDGKSPEEPTPRIAVTMTPSQGHEHLLKSITHPKTVNIENPFEERVDDDIFFTQYISVPSPTSSGKSAAWIAKNWHLLNHLAELEETTPSNVALFWIDLLGDFPNQKLANMRLRLDEVKRKHLISQSEHTRLENLLSRIRFINLRDETDSFLIDNDFTGIEQLRSTILSTLSAESENRIVVVDGWPEFEEMVPDTRRNNLRILELSLLQVLKEHSQEVIWVDRGTNHPMMSEAYQRPCVSPLHHTSPRKQFVDEIIWNLPTAPRKTGWRAPQYDDCRVIIQDIPTKHSPWTTLIRIPHLKGWTRKFSAATVKSPIIEVTEYIGIVNQHRNMYGKSFHCESIQVRSDSISKGSMDSIKKQALKLVPSLLRLGQEQQEDVVDDWLITYHPVDVEQYQPSLTSRLHLDVSQPLPHPNRLGKTQDIYVEADDITRGWIHKEIIEDGQSTTIRRPPDSYPSHQLHIDTLETRRGEIQRLGYASEFLSRRSSHFQSLYREIVSICNYDRSDSVNEDALLTILVQVRDTILRRQEPKILWKLLLHSRLSLGNLLNTNNQKSLRQTQGHNPELLELYGMNLFLAILSVADRVMGSVESSLCIQLWSAIAKWQLYQIGFRRDDDEDFDYRYDFQAIHSNLLRRAKQMKVMKTTERSRFVEHFGQLLWQDKNEGGSIWLLFPSLKTTMHGALLENQMSAYLRHGWYRCAINPQLTKSMAVDALSREGWEELPIATVEINNQHILFVKSEGEDDEEWVLVGVLEYGNPPKEKSLPVRWVRLSQPLPETILALQGYIPDSPPADIQEQCNRVLQEAVEWHGVVREVSCFLTINLEKKVYRINLIEDSKAIARKESIYTDEIIRFLKYPQRKGEYFKTPDGTYLKWDPQTDVEYDEVIMKNTAGGRAFYYLSVFKPLIHRSSFYPEIYEIPSTCEDFLQTKEEETITLRISVDELRKERGLKKYFKIHLDGIREKGRLTGFESEDMGIFDVALLAECDQLVDVESSIRYSFTIDADALVKLRLVHILSEFPRLQGAIIGHIEELESMELDAIKPDIEDDELVREEGPELRFVSVEIEESVRRRVIDVSVQLCNVDDEMNFEELILLSFSSEIAKTQAISSEFIDQEVKWNLRGYRVADDTKEEIVKEIEMALENTGVYIDYS